MTDNDLENLVAAQAALIAALDGGDIGAIEAATAAMSRVIAVAKGNDGPQPVRRDKLDYALRQGEAARTRVNYLADRTRQRLDLLTEIRGGTRPATYDSQGRFAVYVRH